MTRLLSLLFASALLVAGADAAPNRTFVASTGNDINPCSLLQPCRGFQAAVAAVAPGGEVVALDSAGYGPFTVDRPVTVAADGVHASISVLALNGVGITVGAGPTDVVTIRNITFLGPGGQNAFGVQSFDGVGTLFVENCHFANFFAAVECESFGDAQLHVTNTIVESGTGPAIFAEAFDPGHVHMTVDNCTLSSSGSGVFAGTNAIAVATGTVASGMTVDGAFVAGIGGGTLTLDRCVASGSIAGITANETGDVVRVADCVITNNTVGLQVVSAGGSIVSMGGNRLIGNDTDGTFTSTVPSQ